MMMIAASLMWAGAVEKLEQSKIILKDHQNDVKRMNQKVSLLDNFGWSVGQAKKKL